MEQFTTDIPKYNWRAVVYSNVTCDDMVLLLDRLREAGCSGPKLLQAERNIGACRRNTGITYSNGVLGVSVVIIYRTTGPEQYVNSLSHEVAHLCQHIAEEYGIDPFGEEICGLYGDTMQSLYGLIHKTIKNS